MNEVRELYERGFLTGASGVNAAFVPPNLHKGRMAAAMFAVFDLSLRLGRPVTVLDYGCGTGSLLTSLLEEDKNDRSVLGGYVGVDIAPSLLSKARQDHPDYKFFLTEEMPRCRYDIVVCSGVLTHYPEVLFGEGLSILVDVCSLSSHRVFIETQHHLFYTGSFRSHRVDDISRVLRCEGFTSIVSAVDAKIDSALFITGDR